MLLPWSPLRSHARAPSADATASACADDTLDGQLRNECEAMARFALRHGLPVPQGEAMARFALRHGLPVPPEAIAELARLIARAEATAAIGPEAGAEPEARHTLAALHGKLSATIAPANSSRS